MKNLVIGITHLIGRKLNFIQQFLSYPGTQEIKALFKQWPIWFLLGHQDIKLKYKRSVIGPWWITINMSITIMSIGFLYQYLFNIKTNHYFPFLATNIISWHFISSTLIECCHGFIESEGFIKNQKNPLSLFIMRIILRNCIILSHHLVALIPLFFIFTLTAGINLLWLIPNLFIVIMNLFFWGTMLGLLGTRYRDFGQIVTQLMQAVFFITPIMWPISLLPIKLQIIECYNPFYQLINLIRQPLLNVPLKTNSLFILFFITLLGIIGYLRYFSKYKNNIIFWL